MRCYNCGYINFKRVKKCPSCNTSLQGTQSHVELAEDPSFTVFAGEIPDFSSGYNSDAALDEEFGVQEPVSDDGDFGLDLDEAEGVDTDLEAADTDFEGVDTDFDEAPEPAIASGLGPDVGPNDFELDLSEAIAEQVMASPTADSVEIGDDEISEDELVTDMDVEDDLDLDLATTDDDLDLEPTVEADTDLDDIGFDLDDAGETDSAEVIEAAEDDLDLDLGTADDEPTLDLGTADDEPALDLGTADDEPKLVDPEPEFKLPDEEPVVSADGDDEISFSMDDEAESAAPAGAAEPAEEVAENKKDEEGGIEFGGLEMEETPDKDK